MIVLVEPPVQPPQPINEEPAVPPNFEINDIVPIRLGIRVNGANPKDRSDDQMAVVIDKNIEIPCSGRVVKRTARKN